MIVIDASVTLAWCFADEQDDYADRMLSVAVAQSAAAPAHWPFEVANAVRSAEKRGRVHADEIGQISQMLDRLEVDVIPVELSTALWDVLDIARLYDLSAYDAGYLALARHKGVALATLDDKLRLACEQAGIELAE